MVTRIPELYPHIMSIIAQYDILAMVPMTNEKRNGSPEKRDLDDVFLTDLDRIRGEEEVYYWSAFQST